jgi:hypothetical protein
MKRRTSSWGLCWGAVLRKLPLAAKYAVNDHLRRGLQLDLDRRLTFSIEQIPLLGSLPYAD